MRHLSKIFISTFIVFPNLANAGFDFGGDGKGCNGGNGNFKQQINYYGGDYENAITVGTIKKGLKDVYISLKSAKDVDIRLYDVSGKKIVQWPNGLLNGPAKDVTNYNGVTVEYSGYNGDGSSLGYEYIKISGAIKNDFVMKAFGYEAGYANVDYSWAGKENCSGGSSPSASGSGDFQQQILNNAIVKVGDIPPGVNNLYITLKSDKDVDIQLHDKDNGKKIVHWPDGVLNVSSKQTTTYKDMEIQWSGYNGDGTGFGNEYIKITGKTTRNLTMKAFGYEAGYATVNYSWGQDGENLPITWDSIDYPVSPYTSGSYAGRSFYYDSVHLGEDINLAEGTAIRAIADGYIKEYRSATGYGNLVVVIEHELDSASYNSSNFHFYEGDIKSKDFTGDAYCGIYGHLRKDKLTWSVGNFVQKGDVVGYIENRNSNGDGNEHLHMGIFAGEHPGQWAFYGYKGSPSYADVQYFVSATELIEKLRTGLDVYDFWRISGAIYHSTNTNFNAQFKLKNITTSPITVERRAITIHNTDGSYLFDLFVDSNAITIKPGSSTNSFWGEGAIRNAGNYKVVAKVYLNGRWIELASQDIIVQ